MGITDDPWLIIIVDTSKLSKELQDSVWMNMDGADGTLGGDIKISLGNFLDTLKQEKVIK